MITGAEVAEILRTRSNGRLFHREGQELEFKEQFNFGGLADYFRDFAAFSNNRGGSIVFGVKDAPRTPEGMSASSLRQFEKIDPGRITGFLLETFSPAISWERATFEVAGRPFGVFRVSEAAVKPVIAKKNEGKQSVIKNGEVYYRYGGRTQEIQFAELESIINSRVERNNKEWLDLVQKIGAAGPESAAILDTEAAMIGKHDRQIMVVDEELAKKLRIVSDGQLGEGAGGPAIKLVGDVVPLESVEVVRRVKENLIKEYPLSATEVAQAVKREYPHAPHNRIWEVIAENGLKTNPDYSAYNFRNKKQEDAFRDTGLVPQSTPSIYRKSAVDFIVRVIRNEHEGS